MSMISCDMRYGRSDEQKRALSAGLLRVISLDTRLLELRRPDLIIQKRRRNQVLQVVVRLLLGLRSVF